MYYQSFCCNISLMMSNSKKIGSSVIAKRANGYTS